MRAAGHPGVSPHYFHCWCVLSEGADDAAAEELICDLLSPEQG